MTCARCQHTNVKRFGTYGRAKIQRFCCKACGATFAEPHSRPLGNHTLDFDRAVQIVSLLMEGVSVRSVSRLTGAHKGTILALLVTIGKKCQSILDQRVVGLTPHYVQADELWTLVHTKQGHLRPGDPDEWGDAYTWLALDSDTKLIISHLVGKRDAVCANAFVGDFALRLKPMWRCQLTSDGFAPYVAACEQWFGADLDFAQLVKVYGKPDNSGPDWYGPAKVIETIPTPISGNPEMERISTSHIERANLSVRTHLRRFTRLSLGFSKKLANLRATVALWVCWYNFCRVHLTLRVTPAMEAGLTDHVWTVAEMLNVNAVKRAA
ncbi:MAG TPA: IS1 family transposase [Candidatus Eisenbacteria bacterium]|nr:IS1 family transposase [Candidatus Eisenbacteria bacterium]